MARIVNLIDGVWYATWRSRGGLVDRDGPGEDNGMKQRLDFITSERHPFLATSD